MTSCSVTWKDRRASSMTTDLSRVRIELSGNSGQLPRISPTRVLLPRACALPCSRGAGHFFPWGTT